MKAKDSLWLKSVFKSFLWLAFGLLLLLFFFVSILLFEREKQAQSINLENEILAYDAQHHIQNHLELFVKDIRFLSALPEQLGSFNSFPSKEEVKPLFYSYMQQRKQVLQLRWLDKNGQEILRFNQKDGIIKDVASHELQNKQDRYYFKDAVYLAKGRVAVSALDLNVEKGQVETPFQPVIRFSSPVYTANGEAKGVIVLNICAKALLKEIDSLKLFPDQSIFLANEKGYWMLPPPTQNAWGNQLNLLTDNIKLFYPNLSYVFNDQFWIDNYWVENGRYLHALTIHPFTEDVTPLIDVNRAENFIIIVEKPEPGSVMELIEGSQVITEFLAISAVFLVITSIFIGFYSHRREQLEKRAEFQQGLFKHFFDGLPEAMYLCNSKGKIIFENAKTEKLKQELSHLSSNYDKKQLLLSEKERATEFRYMKLMHQGHYYQNKDIEFSHEANHYFYLRQTFLIEDENDELNYLAIILIDLSAEKNLEQAMRQSQKMDAIGSLTGGIAHDFNNLLTGIMGNMDLAKRFISINEEKTLQLIDQSIERSQKAADLIKRLMLIARKQPLEPKLIDLKRYLQEESSLLNTSLPSSIKLQIHTCKTECWVLADAISLETALINLVSNARDSILKSESSVIKIELSKKRISKEELDTFSGLLLPLDTNEYAQIQVIDYGSGMSEQVVAKTIEPFFTTKAHGKGTGLGLPMVYSFVQQSNGSIAIQSKLEVGTSVTLFLPIATEVSNNPERLSDEKTVLNGVSVLLVDDESSIVESMQKGLQQYNLHVSTELSAEQALIRPDLMSLDFIVTDIRMPGMNGLEFAKQLKQRNFNGQVILTSGHLNEFQAEYDEYFTDYPFLAKPYRLNELIEMMTNLKNKEVVL